MSNQLQITGGAKVRSLEGVITGTSGVLGALPINASNGIPQLDSSGKILVSQLPNSVMEYKGTWNVATNTPYLVNGTGNAGDVYIVTGAAVGGTNHDFGAGNILFYNGDQTIYDGSAWQRASGSSGTVTSVGLASSSSALAITNSPITTSGNIGLNFAGSSTQYIAGDGTLVTFPTLITEAQNLICDVYNNTGATLTKGTIVYINGGHGNLPTVTKALATSDATSAQTFGMVQVDITNMNNGHVIVIGQVSDLDTSAYVEGTQLYLSSTTAGAYTSTKQYAPAHLVYVGIVIYSHPVHGIIEVKIQNGYELDELHNVSAQTPSNNQGIFYNSTTSLWENKSIATALGYTPANTSLVVPYTGATGAVTLGSYSMTAGSFIKTGGTSNQFLKADGSVDSTLYVQSVSGTAPVSSSGGNTPVISMHVADTYNDGYLSSANWNTFNNKANASGTSGQVSFFNGSNSLTSSNQFWYSNSYSRLGIGDFSSLTIPAALSTISVVGAWYNGTTAAASYNGIGLSFDSGGYGHLFQTDKVGTAPAANVSFLNYNTVLSLDENYNVGINTRVPVPGTLGPGGVGLDIFGGSSTVALALHNTASGTTYSDGGRLYLTNSGGLVLRNFETGGITATADNGDFTVLAGGYEKIKAVNGGYVGIMSPASITQALTVNGNVLATSHITSGGTSSQFVKGDGTLDSSTYLTTSSASSTYVPLTRQITINGTTLDLSTNVNFGVGTVTGTGIATRVAFWSGSGSSTSLSSNAALYWDNTNLRLGVGTATPSVPLDVNGSIYASGTGNVAVRAESSDNFPLFQFVDTRYPTYAWNFENGRAGAGILGFYANSVGTVFTLTQAGAGTFSSSVTATSFVKTGGTYSQFLKANGSVDSTAYGTFTLPSLTQGSVLFSDGTTIAQNNSKFYWDNTYYRLGVGTIANTSFILHAYAAYLGNAILAIENPNITGTTALRLISNNSIGSVISGFSYNVGTNTSQLYTDVAMKVTSGGGNGMTLAITTGAATFDSYVTIANNNNLYLTSTKLGGDSSFNFDIDYNTGGTPSLTWYGGSTTSKFKVTSTGAATFSSDISINNSGTAIPIIRATSSSGALVMASGATADYDGGANITLVSSDRNGSKTRGEIYISAGNATNLPTTYGFIALSTANTERMRITYAGNVGIGTTSPNVGSSGANDTVLTIAGKTTGYGGTLEFQMPSYASTSGDMGFIKFFNGTTENARIYANPDGANTDSGKLLFYTRPTAGSLTERMRITSGGDCILQQGGTFIAYTSTGGTYGMIIQNTSNNTSATPILFRGWNGTTTGSIATYVNLTTYNTSSDYRLKEDFKEFNGLDLVSKLKMYDFKWKEADWRMYGGIAHEMAEVVPYAVNGEKDEVDKDGNISVQGVDYSTLVPILIKSIQELNDRLYKLENK